MKEFSIDELQSLSEKIANALKGKILTAVDFAKNSLTHIFRVREGHYSEASEENIKRLLEVASDMKNYLGTCVRGQNQWFHQIDEKGQQVWVCVRNRLITDGGLNLIPRSFDLYTGLGRNVLNIGKSIK